MKRELGRLLRGNQVQQDLLGLITAAGGGLSARDLAELTGIDAYEIEELDLTRRDVMRRANLGAYRAWPSISESTCKRAPVCIRRLCLGA